MRIRARNTAIKFLMMTRGSGSADPGVRTVVKNFMMTRGSGEYGSGRQNRYQNFFMMTRGSGEYRSGRQNRYQKFFYDDARIRGVWIRASEPLSGKL
jgi:hypothetical protein